MPVDGDGRSRQPAAGEDLHHQAAERVADEGGLGIEQPDHVGQVVGDVLDRLLGEDIGVGVRLGDGLRIVGPARGERAVAGCLEGLPPPIPASGEEPQAVDEDDRNSA